MSCTPREWEILKYPTTTNKNILNKKLVEKVLLKIAAGHNLFIKMQRGKASSLQMLGAKQRN